MLSLDIQSKNYRLILSGLGCLLSLLLYCSGAVVSSEAPTLPTSMDTKSLLQEVQLSNQSNQLPDNLQPIPLHVVWALYFLNEQESPLGSNRGAWVDKFNDYFKLSAVPWCGSSAGYFSEQGQVYDPYVRSASAKAYGVKDCAHSLNDIYFGKYTPKCGDYRVKRRAGGNHIDIVLSWDSVKQEGYLIGGNVSDKVTIRKVTLKGMIADGTTAITEVHGCYYYVLPDCEFSRTLKQYCDQFKIKEKQPYYAVTDSLKITATYYSTPFHGKKTSNGETFDKTKLTAAHKTLPFGTMLYVVNPKNNKTVIVRINDRCPTAGILDLSKAAADSIRLGSGKVRAYKLTMKYR